MLQHFRIVLKQYQFIHKRKTFFDLQQQLTLKYHLRIQDTIQQNLS